MIPYLCGTFIKYAVSNTNHCVIERIHKRFFNQFFCYFVSHIENNQRLTHVQLISGLFYLLKTSEKFAVFRTYKRGTLKNLQKLKICVVFIVY